LSDSNVKPLIVSPSPHVASDESVPKLMYAVLFALLPAAVVSILFFGWDGLRVLLLASIFCLLVEYLIVRFILQQSNTLADGSALITGLLLGFNLPSNLPSWMIFAGSVVAIGVAKMTFGGLGRNPFNPALVGRVFLLISFPAQMTVWPIPKFLDFSFGQDAVTGATALSIVKEGLKQGESMEKLLTQLPSLTDLMLGVTGGSVGEVSALALLLGGVFLLFRRVITWHIPVSYLATVAVITGVVWLIDPTKSASPLFHLATGGLMLGAFFMATDYVSTPMSAKGQLVYGIGCGVLTVVIRLYGAYPEGVSFAILLMNAATPLINSSFKPARFGHQAA
jgi:Na+-translocating ferredoxin:NAD+ oxidoreductase subunit D